MKKGKLDLILFIAVLSISIFGIIMITSASYVWAEYKFNDPFKFAKHQFIFLLIGFILLLLISKIPYNKYS